MPFQNKSIIDVKQCCFSVLEHDKDLSILKNLSCSIQNKSITLVKGRSGSGKTTFLNCLSGLLVPQKGSITIKGVDLCCLSVNQRANFRLNYMGIVFQSFNFLASLSLKENIILPALLAKKQAKDYIEILIEYSEKFKLNKLLDSMPSQVSGGELQRAAFLRGLINKPDIIFADEPSGNLDSANRDIIFDVMKDIANTTQTSIVFTSHDSAAATIADTILTLEDGAFLRANAT